MQPDTGHSGDKPVGHAGGKDTGQEAVPPVDAPARHDVISLLNLRHQRRDVRRIILQIGIDKRDDLTPSLIDPGFERRGLPKIPAQLDDDHMRRVSLLKLPKDLQAPIVRAIIHEDQFIAMVLKSFLQGIEEWLKVFLLVIDRDDNGELDCRWRPMRVVLFVQAPPRFL